MEAYPEAAAILATAGWKPHDGWNVYTRDTLVMGFQPDGQAFHVKNWASVQEGHPQWTADTPDTAEEAAAWLVARFKPVNDLTTEATPETPHWAPGGAFEPMPTEDDMAQPININIAPVFNVGGSHSESGATQSAAERDAIAAAEALFNAQGEAEVLLDEIHAPQHPESEQTGEAAEEGESAVGGGASASTAEDLGGAEDGSASGGGPLQPYDGQDGSSDSEREYAFDADYEEAGEDLGVELLDDTFGVEPALLDAPPPEDFAPEDFATEPEAPQDRFIGLDDLDRRRSLRIGDVVRISRALQANVKIEMGDHDFANIQGFVVRDTVDGVYRGNQETYELFVRLATLQNAITRIQHAEAEKVAFLESASREDVESFISEEGWP